MKAIVELKLEHWTKEEIRVAVQSWLWVIVELIAWSDSSVG